MLNQPAWGKGPQTSLRDAESVLSSPCPCGVQPTGSPGTLRDKRYPHVEVVILFLVSDPLSSSRFCWLNKNEALSNHLYLLVLPKEGHLLFFLHSQSKNAFYFFILRKYYNSELLQVCHLIMNVFSHKHPDAHKPYCGQHLALPLPFSQCSEELVCTRKTNLASRKHGSSQVPFNKFGVFNVLICFFLFQRRKLQCRTPTETLGHT